MHLVIYTQKRKRPLIIKLHVIVPALLVLLILLLLALPVYLGFKRRALVVAAGDLDQEKALTAGEILVAEKRISSLEERIRYVEENPTTPDVLFEALRKNFASGPPDTLIPLIPVEYLRVSGETIYAIRLAGLDTREAALRAAEDYRQAIAANIEIEELELPGGRLYRVMATGFRSARQAENYARNLLREGKISDYLIQEISLPDSNTAAGENNSIR